jgi:hypothetical protein
MSWSDEIALELSRARQAIATGNAGRTRTAARRAVGIAVTEYQRRYPQTKYGSDFMRQIGGIAEDGALPLEVREAAARLQSRISQDFTSDSTDPLSDATVIITFIEQALLL